MLKPADISHLNSDEDCLRAFTEVYTEAVHARLRCQVQPASMLSGGLDSSTIVALASGLLADAGKPPLRTYSAISELGVPCPETRSIEAVVSFAEVDSTALKPSVCDIDSADLNRAMALLEDPFDGSWSLLRQMLLSAARDGSRVLLDGLDGEHAVGAPTHYLTFLLRGGHWLTAWREARGFSRHYWRGYHSPLKLYGLALRGLLVPGFLRRLKRRLMRGLRYRQLVKGQVIAADLCRRVDLPGRVVEYDHSTQLDPSEGLLAWHLHTLQVPYLTAAIERYERLGSYFGLETRHPLLDIRLLELSVALPLDQKVRGGWSKYLLRQVAQQRLPYSVAWREGWEELGWSFSLAQAQKLATKPDFSMDTLQRTLAPFTDRQSFARSCRAGFDGDEKRLVDCWQQYLLCQWLQR